MSVRKSSVIEFQLQDHKIKLEDLPDNILKGPNRGSSPNCTAKKSKLNSMMIGICVGNQGSSVGIYRAFRNSFDIRSNGISREVQSSEEWVELHSIEGQLKKYFNKHGIKFSNEEPKHVKFQVLKAQFKLSR